MFFCSEGLFWLLYTLCIKKEKWFWYFMAILIFYAKKGHEIWELFWNFIWKIGTIPIFHDSDFSYNTGHIFLLKSRFASESPKRVFVENVKFPVLCEMGCLSTCSYVFLSIQTLSEIADELMHSMQIHRKNGLYHRIMFMQAPECRSGRAQTRNSQYCPWNPGSSCDIPKIRF